MLRPREQWDQKPNRDRRHAYGEIRSLGSPSMSTTSINSTPKRIPPGAGHTSGSTQTTRSAGGRREAARERRKATTQRQVPVPNAKSWRSSIDPLRSLLNRS
jgi:hypothetical protein